MNGDLRCNEEDDDAGKFFDPNLFCFQFSSLSSLVTLRVVDVVLDERNSE